MSEISIVLMGGLGNQLFQIYALLSTVLSQNKPFVFPIRLAGRRQRIYTDTIFRNLRPFFKDRSVHPVIGYHEPHYHYSPIPVIDPGTSLHGYFQSYRYFQDHMSVVNSILQIDQQKSTFYFQEILGNTLNLHLNGIAMHFRVGDYKQLQECHPVLTREYYENALNFIQDQSQSQNPKIQHVTYFYEREDQTHVLEIVNYLKLKFANLSFSPCPSGLQDYEEMLVMSMYAHNIIANSSFSWWSAMYNDNPDKVVCYPDIWFGSKMSDHDTKDLCPPDWHRVPTDQASPASSG